MLLRFNTATAIENPNPIFQTRRRPDGLAVASPRKTLKIKQLQKEEILARESRESTRIFSEDVRFV